MPGGRPRLSEEEKLRRLAEKEGKKAADALWKASQAKKTAEATPKRGVGRPAKSLADRVADIRSGKVQVKNLYKDKDVFFRAVEFPRILTHALPSYIVQQLPLRSPTRLAVADDPDLPRYYLPGPDARQVEEFVASLGIEGTEEWLRANPKHRDVSFVNTLLERAKREKRKLSAKK